MATVYHKVCVATEQMQNSHVKFVVVGLLWHGHIFEYLKIRNNNNGNGTALEIRKHDSLPLFTILFHAQNYGDSGVLAHSLGFIDSRSSKSD